MTAPVLFIGGMDSSGGAGLLRDATTALAMNAAYRVAVTAVTAQTDRQVAASHAVPPAVVAAQIALAVSEGACLAKTGMLANAAVVQTVADNLPAALPLVIDPVLRASSGRMLLSAAGVQALLAQLVPRAALLTPNLPELQALAQAMGIGGAPEQQVVLALLNRGCAAVLVKGGHSPDAALCQDRLYRPGQPTVPFSAARLPGTLRGTGCQLASAIAVALAGGAGMVAAVKQAKAQVTRRFQAEGLRGLAGA